MRIINEFLKYLQGIIEESELAFNTLCQTLNIDYEINF